MKENTPIFRKSRGIRLDTLLSPEQLADVATFAIVRDAPIDYERPSSEAVEVMPLLVINNDNPEL